MRSLTSSCNPPRHQVPASVISEWKCSAHLTWDVARQEVQAARNEACVAADGAAAEVVQLCPPVADQLGRDQALVQQDDRVVQYGAGHAVGRAEAAVPAGKAAVKKNCCARSKGSRAPGGACRQCAKEFQPTGAIWDSCVPACGVVKGDGA